MVKDEEALRILMVEYQAGSLDAFQQIYGILASELLRYLHYLVREPDAANDLLQETFLRLHRSRADYNPAFAVRPWLFGLARNVFLMQRRAARRFAAVHNTNVEMPEVPVPPDVDQFASKNEIRRSIAGLSQEQAEALLLHHEWGFTFEEIAGLIGVTAATARARASRGMADLRKTLCQPRRVGA